jgi:hypothetical protein
MNCTGTTSDIVHYCPLPYPSISPFQMRVKALRAPLNTSHRLSPRLICVLNWTPGVLVCSLRAWASVFIAFKYSRGDRRARGQGTGPVCRACQSARSGGVAFDPGYCALPYTGGLCELQESRPANRAGVQMCGQDYPLEAAGRTSPYSR